MAQTLQVAVLIATTQPLRYDVINVSGEHNFMPFLVLAKPIPTNGITSFNPCRYALPCCIVAALIRVGPRFARALCRWLMVGAPSPCHSQRRTAWLTTWPLRTLRHSTIQSLEVHMTAFIEVKELPHARQYLLRRSTRTIQRLLWLLVRLHHT
jgi:hypothetical protein